MRDPVPPLLGLRAFEASARHLGFAAAAAELHLSPAAVSQRVRVLEKHLGVPLFERRARSLRLTSAGEAYLPAVRVAFDDLGSATTSVFGTGDQASLVIRAQVSYAATWLAPRLPRFTERHPHVAVRLITAIWADTLRPGDSELEIRQGTGAWPGFEATPLHTDLAVAVQGATAGTGKGARRGDLLDRPRIEVMGLEEVGRQFAAANGRDASPSPRGPAAAITVDTSLAALELVASGDYWTIVPERFARGGVRAGRLSVVGGPLIPLRQGHFLLRREDGDGHSGESLAFERWLREEDRLDPALGPTDVDAPG